MFFKWTHQQIKIRPGVKTDSSVVLSFLRSGWKVDCQIHMPGGQVHVFVKRRTWRGPLKWLTKAISTYTAPTTYALRRS